jgi:2-polyprenyl-3-methyl-5-hydroxy-6-metoxy-1,4-benzoquinol methylase
MLSPDFAYLRRIEMRESPAALLSEKKFLDAQKLFFSVVESLQGTVDFDIADMREVHAVAALGDVNGLKVLDVGCGSTLPYVLEDTFRDRYPPFFAEMLAKLGADVTGTDIRPNLGAGYRHLTLDCTKDGWMTSFRSTYDVIACLNIFNAPKSPFEHDAALCDRLMDDMRSVLSPDGILIVTLRDDLFLKPENAPAYIASKKFHLLHLDGNCAWLHTR